MIVRNRKAKLRYVHRSRRKSNEPVTEGQVRICLWLELARETPKCIRKWNPDS